MNDNGKNGEWKWPFFPSRVTDDYQRRHYDVFINNMQLTKPNHRKVYHQMIFNNTYKFNVCIYLYTYVASVVFIHTYIR